MPAMSSSDNNASKESIIIIEQLIIAFNSPYK